MSEETIMKADVEQMIRDWQLECSDHPALHNQGNVLLGRLKALKPSLAMNDFLTGMDAIASSALTNTSAKAPVACGIPDGWHLVPTREFMDGLMALPHEEYISKWKASVAEVDTFLARPQSAAVRDERVPCPCTMIEQDEDCVVGYPSLICGICDGKGHTTPEQVTALACEMIKIASDLGEPEDPFAAWESVSLIQSQNDQMRKALEKISSPTQTEGLLWWQDEARAALHSTQEG